MDDTPRTIEETYSSPDADYWKEAVRSEMDSIMSIGTWEVVDGPGPPGRNAGVHTRRSGGHVEVPDPSRGEVRDSSC